MLARGKRLSLAAVVGACLLAAASAFAFQQLPAGGRVNDDAANGINKNLSVSGEEPTNADVVGGSLVAGNRAVPWAIFRQQETNGTPPPTDQVFVRSFANGAWTTRGSGTVGGRSSGTPAFPASLNFSKAQNGEAPSIDFAGTGRAVPWASWYEFTPGSGIQKNNVFASRFDNTGDANQGKWIFSGQSRGTGGGSVLVPSLNIHTDQSAENPSVAGGSAVDPTKPGPWITWQETTTAPVSGRSQIFTVRPIGPASANCDGVTPAGVAVSGHVPAVGGFCWQQVGIPRVGPSAADPSLNIDPTRNGIEPDIAFTGANDSVPWVVWYETGPTQLTGLHTNGLVFAAKAVSDGVSTNGGFHWVAVGNSASGTLDTTATNGFGACAASGTVEAQCSLNKSGTHAAEDPRVAAGTMVSGNPTVPWVAWDEKTGAGVRQIFVSRLVATPTPHFQIANSGIPISSKSFDASRPDITFSGNTPYVTWRANVNGVDKGFSGHFTNPTNPTFVTDQTNIPLTATAQADVREPVSSGCTANPFNSDGSACQGSAIGTPFFLFTNTPGSVGGPRGLFAGAYKPATPSTGAPSSITSSSATVSGSVNPHGARAEVIFEFGTSPLYGMSSAPQFTGPDDTVDTLSANFSGLTTGMQYHYRIDVITDFGTLVGKDSTFTTN